MSQGSSSDPRVLRVALGQINPVVGDLRGNADRIIEVITQAQGEGAQIVAFPELALTGYPPEDLLLHKDFIGRQEELLYEIARSVTGSVVLLGAAHTINGSLANGAAVLMAGEVVNWYHKIFLPNYGVFDEKRYFTPGESLLLLDRAGVTIGVNICEDIWIEGGVTESQGFLGDAEIVINLSSSPYHMGKWHERERILADRARSIAGFIAYVNLVGGQDELVFDGGSMIVGPDGQVRARAAFFEKDLLICDLPVDESRTARREAAYREKQGAFTAPWPLRIQKVETMESPHAALESTVTPTPSQEEEVYRALMLGVHDYVLKNGFSNVVIGLSGGIDSAMVAVIARDSLGPERVHALFMPSSYTADMSREDAEILAGNLGIDLTTLPIGKPYTVLRELFPEGLHQPMSSLADENLQARIRGLLLMAASNTFGWLVLTTGNKSEVSVGYSTLYGDTAGGFAVIKDLYKTMVYRLARWRNERDGVPVIPERIITRPPSAELKPDQTDQDTLPSYEVLDGILKLYVEKALGSEAIVREGFDDAIVRRVIAMVERSEYKRRQSPPGIKLTPTAFGRDRRMPITNRYR